MIYDFIVMEKTIEELKEKLTGGLIVKVLQPSRLITVMEIRERGQLFRLLISAEPQIAAIYITGENFSETSPPHNFSLLLKKHILNGRIEKIDIVPLERIAKIDIKARNEVGEIENFAIIAEIMGKHSNIILIDKKDRTITGALKHITSKVNRYRVIIPGEIYMPPPAGDKKNPAVDKDLFISLLEKAEENKIEKALTDVFKGTGLLLAKESIIRSGLSGDIKKEEISEENLNKLYKAWQNIWNPVEKKKEFLLYMTSEGKKPPWETPLAYPEELELFKDFPQKKFKELNPALDYGYKTLKKEEKLKSGKNTLSTNIRQKIKKNRQIEKTLEKELKKAEKAEEYRQKGDILLANTHIKLDKDTVEVELLNFYDEEQKNIKITVDSSINISQNAQNYFKKYKKTLKIKDTSEKDLKEIKEELNYLENILLSIEICDSIEDLEEIKGELFEGGILKKGTKKSGPEKKQPFITFTSPDGWQIFVGKNNRQNDLLTMKVARGNDIWLHVKGAAGSHVIIKNETSVEVNKVPYRTLLMGAELAAYYSKYRNSSNVLVDYTQRKFVKKPRGAKPGMVIYHGEKSLYVEPAVKR